RRRHTRFSRDWSSDVCSSDLQTPLPTSAPSCFVRTDWPAYIVQAGDTLFGIALWTGINVDQLALANCLANPNAISAGQVLRVPRSEERRAGKGEACAWRRGDE